MIPKRKLIKKQFVAPETSAAQQQARFQSDNLFEKLQSSDPKQKLDALSAIANLQSLPSEIQQQLLSTSSLTQMLKILTVGSDLSMIQTTLFAIHNICILDTQSNNSMKIVDQLFALGLDKALLNLDSSNCNIIKPILVLMTDIAMFVPKKYKYLLEGMQSTLVSQCQKYLTQEGYYDLVIQFLMRSNYTIQFKEGMDVEKLAFINILRKISQMDKNYKNRAIASRLLVSICQGKSKQLVEIFFSSFEEFLNDMNLEKEYQINFKDKDNDGQEEEEEQEDQMDQCMKEENRKLSRNVQLDNPNYKIFLDAVEGVQILLQFLVQKLEDEENFNDEDGEDGQEEMSSQQNQIEESTQGFYKQFFFFSFANSLTRVFKQFEKFTQLSFLEGQNLLELLLRLILSLPKSIVGFKNQQHLIPVQYLIMMTQKIIVHQFKQQLQTRYRIPQAVLIFNIKTAFQVIIKYKVINNRAIYIEIPTLKYNNSQQNIMGINRKWKQCWIMLLQIYSIFYNPEKFPAVSDFENKTIGALLKRLIIDIPEIQLSQWRAQAIDTLFDIYSNENFDKNFMEFGFVEILNQVLKIGGGKVKGKAGNKSTKFISAVVADIQRFIAYKKKMIGF